MKNFNELIDMFDGARRIRNGSYMVKCPCHDDNTASLHISQVDNRIIMYCHAGCKPEDILDSKGLKWSDLSDSVKENNTYNCLERFVYGLRGQYGAGAYLKASYDYHDENGRYLYTKIRIEGLSGDEKKTFRQGIIDYKNDTFNPSLDGVKQTLYNLPELLKAIKNGYPVYIVEGEKDVETLRKLGLTATTDGSTSNWHSEYAKYFKGARVIVLYDNDAAGERLKDEILRDIKKYAFATKALLTSKAPKGDVTDYIEKEGHGIGDLKMLESVVDFSLCEWAYNYGKNQIKINASKLADNIQRNEPYLILRQPNDDKDSILYYSNGVYQQINKNGVKALIGKYIPVEYKTDNQLNEVYNLLLASCDKALQLEELDTDERYINFQNGLYDLETKRLGKHLPNIYCTRQIKCAYNSGLTEAPVFMKYLNDLTTNEKGEIDTDIQKIIQEWCGLIISQIPVYKSKKAMVLHSQAGNTGKSLLLNLIQELIGIENTVTLPIQNMNEKNKFAIGGILGKRLISNGDQTGSAIEDSSYFKQITGGDQIKAEQKNKQPIYIRFTGGVMIACNGLPYFSDDKGSHLFERLLLIPCTNVIPADKRDPEMLKKMKKELPAIANWMLAGLHRLINNNYKFTESAAVTTALQNYRKKMDTLYRFIDETNIYTITDDRKNKVSVTDFSKRYESWCQAEGCTPMDKKSLIQQIQGYGVMFDSKANIGERRGIQVFRMIKEVS